MAITYSIDYVVMYDEALYSEGHLIRRWFEGIEEELEALTRLEAPLNRRANKNSGEPPVGSLKAGIKGETNRTGPRALEAIISSSAYYTRYVIGGTPNNIFYRGQRGQFGIRGFSLPPNFGIPRKRVQRVSGQDPNDFFLRAYETAAAHHEALG
jgi:hypothetical protein